MSDAIHFLGRAFAMRGSEISARVGLGACAVVLAGGLGLSAARGGEKAEARSGVAASKTASVSSVGRELFHREWLPGDSRGHGGDGLGPVFNDSSCVACHNQGAPGGAGPNSKNVDILSAFRINGGVPIGPGGKPMPQAAPSLDPLIAVHAGFRNSRSVVLHKFGVDPNYEAWRNRAMSMQGGNVSIPTPAAVMLEAPPQLQIVEPAIPPSAVLPVLPVPPPTQPLVQALEVAGAALEVIAERVDTSAAVPVMAPPAFSVNGVQFAANGSRMPMGSPIQVGAFQVVRTQRNPTPLFGTGKIDAIPDKALEEAAARRYPEFPEVQGRVSRLKDGRIGKYGWKGQTANLSDFVLTACAVELGLEVPGVSQAIVPNAPFYKADANDLTKAECDALTQYLRELPAPEMRKPSGAEALAFESGLATFTKVGCASCHTPDLGGAKGLFSDLLLHDMGAELADSGQYSPDDPSGDDEPLVPREEIAAAQPQHPGLGAAKPAAPKGASRFEWRTPPLWGVRDSGPYLHDGRAETLEQAIAMHGGQGAASAQRYGKLNAKQKLQLQAFLKSLVAPTELARAGE